MLNKKISKKIKTILIAGLAAGIIAPTTVQTVFAMSSNEGSIQNILSDINIDKVIDDIANLAAKDNARVAGFESEHEAANYIVKELNKLGVKTRKQLVNDVVGYIGEKPVFEVNGENVDAALLTYSNATKGLEGELVSCGLGRTGDFDGIDVKGKIAFIKRGEISFAEKVDNATANGAKGVIIYNNTTGPLNGTLGEYSKNRMPSISLDGETGEAIAERLASGEKVNAYMEVSTQIEENSYSYNVIGNIPAAKNSRTAQTIVIGAHFDSVQCPGANDNASGTAAIIELARLLTQPEVQSKLKYNIELVGFGAEEIGLIGSEQYVISLMESGRLDKVKGMINLDMIGVGESIVTYNLNSSIPHNMTDVAENSIAKLGYEYGGHYNSGSSDHAPFEAYGVPSVFLQYSPDPYYHTDEDTIDKIDPENVENIINVVYDMVLDLQDEEPRVPSPASKFSVVEFENEEIPSK